MLGPNSSTFNDRPDTKLAFGTKHHIRVFRSRLGCGILRDSSRVSGGAVSGKALGPIYARSKIAGWTPNPETLNPQSGTRLTSGTEYYLRVLARNLNSQGYGPPSNAVVATPFAVLLAVSSLVPSQVTLHTLHSRLQGVGFRV